MSTFISGDNDHLLEQLEQLDAQYENSSLAANLHLKNGIYNN